MSIKEKYGLTDEGVRNVKLGAVWTAVSNLVVFAGVGALFLAMGAFVDHLTGSAALPDVVFACERLAYYYQYGVIYKESGRLRIGLAERLRKLPLSFFGRRDLADLTETIMGDVKTIEHAYSHVLPELYGAYIMLVVAAVVLVTVLLIVETFRLLLPGLWSAFSAGDEQALSEYLASQGRLRSFLTLWFLAVVQVLSLVIPAMPVQLAAGLAYGPWMGFLTSFSASTVANMSVYLIARRLVPVIRRLVADNPKAAKLLDSVRSSKDPWFYTILAFITPGLPNGIIPYAAAHANMKPKQFFAAICISMPIPTLLTCLAGSYLVTGDWLFTVLIEGGMFAVVGLLFHKRSAVIGHAHEVKDRHTR